MPYDDTALELVRTTLLVAMKIAAPILLAGLAIGLIVSLLQSITSIQDQTLQFVPKIASMLAVAVLLLPWIAARLIEYAAEVLRLVN